jgi:glyoxylase I family protein
VKDARLLHYSHCVSDIDRSRQFYETVLGFDVLATFDFDDEATAKVMDIPGCKFTGVFMQRDGMRIELIGFQHPRPENEARPRRADEIGHSHLTFYVKDLDAALDELRVAGVVVEDRTRATLDGDVECCIARDPDGFPIEIVATGTLTLLPYEAAAYSS